MPDYRTENLPLFYKVFTTNNDPKTMRDNEIDFIFEKRYGGKYPTTEENRAILYEENPDWIYCIDDEERDYILASRYRGLCYNMGWWYSTAKKECEADGIDITNHPGAAIYPENGSAKHDYAILPKSFWKRCKEEIGFEKTRDYCFVGAWKVDPPSEQVRAWVYDFAEEFFTSSSYLQFTDTITKKDYKPIGDFDHTLTSKWGHVQKELDESKDAHIINSFDQNYYTVMCQSKFALCPAGDAPWSMRMYEALMCKAIPIVMHEKETFRTWEEYQLGYKFYYPDEDLVYREDWVEHNYNLFMKYHTFYGS